MLFAQRKAMSLVATLLLDLRLLKFSDDIRDLP